MGLRLWAPSAGGPGLLPGQGTESESEVAQSCSTLRDPTDCSPPGSSVRGICQARALEWGAIPFSQLQVQLLLIQSSVTVRSWCLSGIKKIKVSWEIRVKIYTQGGESAGKTSSLCSHLSKAASVLRLQTGCAEARLA